MLKVKIFRSRDYNLLQESINEWIMDNKFDFQEDIFQTKQSEDA